MTSTRSIEWILLAIVASFICAKAEPTIETIFEREWSFEKNSLFSYDRSLAKVPDTFVYAYCNSSDFIRQNDCTFVLNHLQASNAPSKTCRTKLTGSEKEDFNFIFERFENNAVVIIRLEVVDNEILSKYSLIDMNTCNIVNSQETFVEENYMQAVTYKHAFDIITRTKNRSCGSNMCRVTQNRKYEVVSEAPFPDYLNIEVVLPVSPDGPHDGFFVVGHQHGSYIVVHVSESGEITKLYSHPLDYINKCHYTPHPRGKFGICCDLSSKQMRCAQLWKEGGAWRSFNVELERKKILTMHNADDRGLVVLTSECVDKLDLTFCDNTTALKLYEGGRRDVLFVISEPVFRCETYDSLTSVEIHESQTNGICIDFAFICSVQINEGYRSTLKLNRRCERNDRVDDRRRDQNFAPPVPEISSEQIPL